MNIQLSNKRMLEYDLNKSHSNILSFSTTRHGGYSEGTYASFNCNDYCGDDLEVVQRNQNLLRELLPGHPDLIIPHQVHKTQVGSIDDSFLLADELERKDKLEGIDAIVSDKQGICLCISTADCIPVLCYDVHRQVIAAIHAGWRGTVGRIVEKTIRVMTERYDCIPADIRAVIGPGISLDSFEVGDEVYQAFETAQFDMNRIARKYDKWHIDLWEANKLQLIHCGINAVNIELAGICTYQQYEDFFSARRLGISSGRIFTGIMLKV